MKQVISVRDLEEMLRNGKDVRSLPEEAILTPSARDFLRDLEDNGKAKVILTSANRVSVTAGNGAPQPPSKPLSSKSSSGR